MLYEVVTPTGKCTHLVPLPQRWVTRTSLLLMASTTLFSARVPFPSGTSQAWRRSCIQSLAPRNSQSIGKCTCTIRATSPSRRACFSWINQEDPSDKVLEITSQDCKWKARKGNGDWKVIDNAELSIPDGKDYVAGFDLGTVGPRGHGGHGFPNRVRFNMYTKNGKSDIAVMSLSCRPSHNMNLQNLNETPERPKVCRWRAEGFTEVAVYAADLHRLGIQHG